jgi:hypothetical protein
MVLVLIFFQDMASRSVYWFLFPLLAAALTWLHFRQCGSFAQLWQSCLLNICFLAAQYVLLTVYFSMKNKKLINISSDLLGPGDMLFLLSAALYLSVLSFLFFYLASLTTILIAWAIYQLVSAKKNKQIPLAGFQALLFFIFLAGDWYLLHVNLTADTWLLNLIHP